MSSPPFPVGAPSPRSGAHFSLLPCPPSQALAAGPDRAAEAEAPIGHRPLGHPLPAQGAACSSRPPPPPTRLHGRYLSSSWSSSIAGRLPGSSGGAGGSEALTHTAKRAGEAGRKERRTEGAEDGRRKEEPQRRGEAQPLGGACTFGPEAPPTGQALGARRAVARLDLLTWSSRSQSAC